jgi:hypothetical protein
MTETTMSRQHETSSELADVLRGVVRYVTAKPTTYEEELRKREEARIAVRLLRAALPPLSVMAANWRRD